MTDKKQKIIIVAGPTASGKSDFAVDLALKVNGEIISADSRQIYRGLDIGTGKITEEEMRGVKHYMLDICDIGNDFSVSDFMDQVLPVIDDIFSSGKTPIICGGTGQYIQAIIYKNSFPQVPPNEKLREELEKLSTEELVTRLTIYDPRRAEYIDKDNRRRLIRALEIIDKKGVVPEIGDLEKRFETEIHLMEPTREELKERIKLRLDKRLNEGMLEEGKKVFEMNLSDEQVKRLGIEYVYMNKYFENKITLEEMKEEILHKSWQYAKRQMVWNKKYLK